jgi:hypothetical protein
MNDSKEPIDNLYFRKPKTTWTQEFLSEVYERDKEEIYLYFEREISLDEFIIHMTFFKQTTDAVIRLFEMKKNIKPMLKQLEKEQRAKKK